MWEDDKLLLLVCVCICVGVYVKHYRTRIEIIIQILEAANGVNITNYNIMYKAYLSFNQSKKYVSMLTEKGLLGYDSDSQTFRTTEKGLMLLEAYNALVDMMMLEKNKKEKA
jgi:predicted transcriptional regulator